MKKESVLSLATAAVATFFTVLFYLLIDYPLPWLIGAILALSYVGHAIKVELGLTEKLAPPPWEYHPKKF